MKKRFEIVEFYPEEFKNKKNIGTIHVYDIECQLDIRGIIVSKNLRGIFFHLPMRNGFDEDKQKLVGYPVVSYTDQEKMLEFKEFLHTEGRKYVFKKLTEIEYLKKKEVEATLGPDSKDVEAKGLKSAKKGQSKKKVD